MYAFEFTMAHDLGIGIIRLQGSKQGDEGSTLGRCPGVGSTAFLIQTSFIADADGMGIVMAGMYADLFFITGLIDLAVLMHNVLAIRYPVRVLKRLPLHPILNRSRYAYWEITNAKVPSSSMTSRLADLSLKSCVSLARGISQIIRLLTSRTILTGAVYSRTDWPPATSKTEILLAFINS